MSETTPNDTRSPLEGENERREDQDLGMPADAARSVAEDRAHPGWRKPASDEVERERIERAQREDPSDTSSA